MTATTQQRRSQGAHRVTNRPSESERTSTYMPPPNTYIPMAIHPHAELMSMLNTFPFKATDATTASAPRSAIQSSDLRQKITEPRVKQRNAKTISSARVKAAEALTER